jgi:hypothetical protein
MDQQFYGGFRSLSNHIWPSTATAETPPKVTVLLNPLHASTLAKEGWTKERIRLALYEESKVPNSLYEKTVVGLIETIYMDGIGEVGNPVCGDMMTFYIKERITSWRM